ncbi:cyclic diguanylate phosphodiesterase [Aliivibrio logei]|uniref:cyclic-guanylate-specific phosphodiesterase n=2 Tax=Aliivibrio TaxID=511678 RepID=A0A1B9P3W1_ALILO|nr:cyclic diguanylate phosphodiesterase [Aliivibrio logei]OCH23185.1 diguanylate phosphodiesterase [Aliivibrio logei]
MKFICNRYIVCIFIIFIVSKYVIFSDYKRFVESNVEGTIAKIEIKLDKAKETVQELDQFKDKNCQEMMIPLQKIVALSPTINSISIIRNGQYYCSSIVGMNISKKAVPEKEINIKEKDTLTSLPAISYYHRYDEANGIQFFMKGIPFDLEENRVGNVILSNQEYTISKENQFGLHKANEEDNYPSAKYDFLILLKYDAASSVKNYLIDNRLVIVISLLVMALLKALSVKNTLFNIEFFTLRKAIKNNSIKPFVQPIVNEKEHIIGGEVLARWITEKRGIISPLEFIPKIEKFGLMNAMTKSLLGQLIECYQNSPKSELRISVNLTESCLYDDGIYLLCKQLCDKFVLVLEFTESTEFEDRHNIISYMQKFRAVGVKFALDDYGKGYSSLQYLNYYQFDFVKIDKSFIDDIETNKQSLKIVENIILLANNLNINLVAEGVENQNQKKILNDLNISSHQGFLYFKPMPLNEFYLKVKR